MARIKSTGPGPAPAGVVAAFLPRRIVKNEPPTGRVMARTGVLLFADVSGFTALTERMGLLGREGAEELTTRLNEFFEVLLATIEQGGGDVLKFGGDALLVEFDESVSLHAAADCAYALVRSARQAGRMKTRVGRFRLQLHIGLSIGSWNEIVCGGPGGRREHFVFGSTVHQCQAAADLASPGQIVVAGLAPRAKSLKSYSTRKLDRGFHLLSPVKPRVSVAAEAVEPRDVPQKTRSVPRLRGRGLERWRQAWWYDFLDPAILSLVREKPRGWKGEHRAVSVVFLFFKGSESWSVAQAETAFSRMFAAIEGTREKWTGVWSRSDPGSAYQKALFLFGAPAAGEHDPQRAVGFALEVRDTLKNLSDEGMPLDFGIGVATGRVFGGIVGAVRRCEYTVMGDAINLAARLAARSFGGTVAADQATAQQAAARYRFDSLGAVEMKGRSGRIPLFRPYRAHGPLTAVGNRTLVEYYPQAYETVRQFLNGRSLGVGFGIAIVGEAGCGKTTLARRVVELSRPKGPQSGNISVTLWPEEAAIAFAGVSRILAEVYRGAGDNPRDLRRAFLSRWPGSINPDWQPLFAPLLNIPLRATRLARGLNRQTRLQKMAELFPEVVASAVGHGGSTIFLDNYQWLDPSSRKVMQKWWAGMADYPVGVIVAARAEDPSESPWLGSSDTCLIELGPVERADIVRLISGRFPGVDPPDRLIRALTERARAVPALVDAYLDYWVEQGLVHPDPRNPRRLHIEDLATEDLPDTLLAGYVRKLDALPLPQAEIIRAASVWGHGATVGQLKHLIPEGLMSGELPQEAARLAHTDYLARSGSDRSPLYAVAHPLMAQAAYQMMSFADRRARHTRAARLLARRRGRGIGAMLARHYVAAGDHQRALPALVAAAREAVPVGAYLEARSFLRQAQQLSRRASDPPLKIEIEAELARIEQELGNYDTARRLYGAAERAAEGHGLAERALLFRQALGRLYWIAGDYRRCQATADRILLSRAARRNRRVLGWARHLQGELRRRRGQFEAAEEMLALALDDFQSVNDRAGLLETRNALGVVAWNQGKLNQAAGQFRAALNLGSAVVDLSARARLYNNLGILSQERASLERARRYYQKAFEIFSDVGHRRNRAYCLGNLANIHRLCGRFDAARAAYEDVLCETEAIGEAHAQAYTLGNLGDLYADYEAFSLAAPYYRRTLAFARRADDGELLAETMIRLALVARHRGDHAQFERHIAKALDLARQAGSVEFQIKAELAVAADLRERGESTLVADKIENLLERATQARLILYQVLCREELARACAERGEFGEATKHALAGFRQAARGGFALLEIRLLMLAANAYPSMPTKGRVSITYGTARHLTTARDIADRILTNLSDERVKNAFLRQPDLEFLFSHTGQASPVPAGSC